MLCVIMHIYRLIHIEEKFRLIFKCEQKLFDLAALINK